MMYRTHSYNKEKPWIVFALVVLFPYNKTKIADVLLMPYLNKANPWWGYGYLTVR